MNNNLNVETSVMTPIYSQPPTNLTTPSTRNPSSTSSNSNCSSQLQARSPGALDWLLKTTPKRRRKHHLFQKLRECSKQVRKDMKIAGKCDPSFAVGVQEVISLYNQTKWTGSLPIDPSNPKMLSAVGSIFAKSLRNKNHRDRKLKKKLDDVAANKETEPKGTKHPIHSIGLESESSGDEDISKSSILTKNDFVLLTDEQKSAKLVADVHKPFILKDNDTLDYNEVEIKVIKAFNGSHLRGDILRVRKSEIVHIPGNREDFAYSLISPKSSSCFRGEDCKLRPWSIVLLDLGETYADSWPLVALVKSYATDNDRLQVQWYWYEDDDDQVADALDRKFSPWTTGKGKPIEEFFSGCNHYFCQIELNDGNLPQSAKLACQIRMGI